MTQRMFTLLLVGYLACLALPLPANQTPSTVQVDPASDNFIGEWKLRAENSNSDTKTEIMKIEPEGNRYKFSSGQASANDKEWHQVFVTNMTGRCVQSHDLKGKRVANACITRLDPNSFVNDDIVWIEHYQVDGDHDTMTMIRTFRLKPDGKTPQIQIVVYDRVKSEPR